MLTAPEESWVLWCRTSVVKSSGRDPRSPDSEDHVSFRVLPREMKKVTTVPGGWKFFAKSLKNLCFEKQTSDRSCKVGKSNFRPPRRKKQKAKQDPKCSCSGFEENSEDLAKHKCICELWLGRQLLLTASQALRGLFYLHGESQQTKTKGNLDCHICASHFT